jgi:N utilization substance protein B
MKRRKERELALQVLYAHEFNPEPVSVIIERLNDDKKDLATDFAVGIIKACIERKEELDEEIREKLQNWDFKRVAIIDKILLRMAIVEFLCFEEIPPEVTLNEIIEIGKMYSTERSGKFINGVLDAVLKKLHREEKIQKRGRGLISNLSSLTP